ncbi:MAG: RNA ligase (ATP) [Promethearchaeia archaeon]
MMNQPKNGNKLASIEKIQSLEEIENADLLLKARVLGWQVVVRKDDGFQVGDLCVYVQVDSVLPEREDFEFLKSKNYRIRTIKLRGTISHGIVFKLDVLPPEIRDKAEEGMDVTEILGVEKYEKPMPVRLDGEFLGNFPAQIPKSDEFRIQAVPEVLQRHQGEKFYITEKLDGTSATFFFLNGEFGVCSRNKQLARDKENSFWRIAIEEMIEEKLKNIGRNLAIQGELIGKGINRNNYELSRHELYIFNAYDIDTKTYLNYNDLVNLVKELDLKTVPVINDAFRLDHTVSELEEIVEGKSKLNPAIPREGIVVRSLTESSDEEIGRLSFKVINSEYELEYEI